jgi:hypothetical protein
VVIPVLLGTLHALLLLFPFILFKTSVRIRVKIIVMCTMMCFKLWLVVWV